MEMLVGLGLLAALVVIRSVEVVLLWRIRRQVVQYLRTRALLELALERGAHSLAARQRAELSAIEGRLPADVGRILVAQAGALFA